MRISLVWVYSKWLNLDLVYSVLCNIKVQPGLALHYVRQYEEQTGLGLPYALLYLEQRSWVLVNSLMYNNCLGLQHAYQYYEQSDLGLQYVLQDDKQFCLDIQWSYQDEDQPSLGLQYFGFRVCFENQSGLSLLLFEPLYQLIHILFVQPVYCFNN